MISNPSVCALGQGQPLGVTGYLLTVGGDDWQSDEVIAVVANDTVSWTDESNYNENGQLIITGNVTNESSDAIRDVQVIVTVFDANQNVIAAGFTNTEAAILLPEDRSNFQLLISDRGGNAANYIVDVQALACE